MKRIGLPAVIAAAAVILAVGLPWDFQGHPHWDKVGWIPFASSHLRVVDVVQNILLGVPLGIAAGVRGRLGIVVAGALAAMASITGELTQVYSHSRFPSATDVVCNVGGAMVAAAVTRVMLRGRKAARNGPLDTSRQSDVFSAHR